MKKVDIAVIGAGISGLAAALQLKEKQQDFVILEARDRTGGRMYTVSAAGSYLDLGAQWVGPTQDSMYQLIGQAGLSVFETYNRGKNIWGFEQQLVSYKGTIPKLPWLDLFHLGLAMSMLEWRAKRISLTRPWLSSRAKRWDQQTLFEFVHRHAPSAQAQAVLTAGLETVFASDLADLSLLQALFYIRSGRNLDRLIRIKRGAQQHRITGGSQAISDWMASQVMDHLKLSTPVSRLSTDDQGVIIHTTTENIRAKKVILALPPVQSKKLVQGLSLSPAKLRWLDGYFMGQVIKCYAVFKTPFWREEGWSGQAILDHHYPVQTLFDNTPAEGYPGMLMGFSIGKRARQFAALPLAERRQKFIKTLARLFGHQAFQVQHYQDMIWADELYSGGCYTGLVSPGTLTTVNQPFHHPDGHLFWAGTEASPVWNGYMEGAVLAGRQAAREAMHALTALSTP